MAFPAPSDVRQLPLSPTQENELKVYLRLELERSESERKPFIDKLKREITLYEAVPDQLTKSWPWQGASNLVVPIIGSMVDTIFPRIYSTIFGVDPTFTCEEMDEDWAEHSKAYQRYLDIVQRDELKLNRIAQSWLMEGIIHGTSVVKLVWDKFEKQIREYDEEGKVTTETRVVKEGPALYRVPLSDFFIPLWSDSIEDAPWVAHRTRIYWGRLVMLRDQGIYMNVDDIEHDVESSSPDYVRKREELEETKPDMWDKEYELFEFWMDYDVDGDGKDEALIVTYHSLSQTLLRVQYNPYHHMQKPFREFIYWPRHDRFYGIGIADMVAPMQDEITTIHNQNLDNRTIANTKMWEIVAGSTADRNFDGVAPGRTVKVDRLGEEISPIQLGEVYSSSFEMEQIPLRYAQQRTGVSDFLSGQDMSGGGGRETATTTMVKMQEARTRFNWTMDSVRMALGDIALMTTSLLQQFAVEGAVARALGDEEAEMVTEYLSLSRDEAREKIGIRVTASTASVNKEAEKQNLIALIQMLQQQTLSFEMPLVQIVINPQAPPALKEYALGKLEGMRVLFDRVLQTFDSRNADEILGSLGALEEALEGAQAPAPQPVGPGGGGAPQPTSVTNMGLPGGAGPGPV